MLELTPFQWPDNEVFDNPPPEDVMIVNTTAVMQEGVLAFLYI